MTSYTQKIIQGLKPDWYLQLGTAQKKKFQRELREEHNLFWREKPKPLPNNTKLVCTKPTATTANKEYAVRGHHCSLVTTVYGSTWNEFITIKNDSGHTIKVNLDNFERRIMEVKWISLKEAPKIDCGEYWTHSKDGAILKSIYSKDHNSFGYYKLGYVSLFCPVNDITHWAEIPYPTNKP